MQHAQSVPALRVNTKIEMPDGGDANSLENKRYQNQKHKYSPINSMTNSNNQFQITFNNNPSPLQAPQSNGSNLSFFPQVQRGSSDRDMGSDHFTSISQRMENNFTAHNSASKSKEVGSRIL